MMRVVRKIALGAAMIAASTQALAQAEQVMTASPEFCAEATQQAEFGTRQRFDGIMLNCIDCMYFTPCPAEGPCKPRIGEQTLDLFVSDEAWKQMADAGFSGWGHYRLRFEGRMGRRNLSKCDLEEPDFYQVDRLISLTRIADR